MMMGERSMWVIVQLQFCLPVPDVSGRFQVCCLLLLWLSRAVGDYIFSIIQLEMSCNGKFVKRLCNQTL